MWGIFYVPESACGGPIHYQCSCSDDTSTTEPSFIEAGGWWCCLNPATGESICSVT
jgi:hypothetical protein